MGHTGQEEWWTLAWHDPGAASKPIAQLAPWHRFPDHDVAFRRSSWNADATALAFKCGPPEGHHAAELMTQLPDWHIEQGHAHPDVNSFILWGHGQYLTGDSGYAGVPKTIEHDTLLIDGKGQGHEGEGRDAWAHFPYPRLNQARITRADFTAKTFDLEGEGASAYDASFGLKRYRRHVSLDQKGHIVIDDLIETEVPRTMSEMLHSGTSVQKTGKQSCSRRSLQPPHRTQHRHGTGSPRVGGQGLA